MLQLLSFGLPTMLFLISIVLCLQLVLSSFSNNGIKFEGWSEGIFWRLIELGQPGFRRRPDWHCHTKIMCCWFWSRLRQIKLLRSCRPEIDPALFHPDHLCMMESIKIWNISVKSVCTPDITNHFDSLVLQLIFPFLVIMVQVAHCSRIARASHQFLMSSPKI